MKLKEIPMFWRVFFGSLMLLVLILLIGKYGLGWDIENWGWNRWLN